jgi:hypothetical protein
MRGATSKEAKRKLDEIMSEVNSSNSTTATLEASLAAWH